MDALRMSTGASWIAYCYTRPLNEESARAKCEERWGPIRLPTITDYINKIFDFWVKEGGDEAAWNRIGWKGDLAGAFTLLSFNPRQIHHLAFSLKFGWVWLPLVGLFGWAGMPLAFTVISRLLLALIAFLIWGFLVIYVDDLLAVSSIAKVDHDIGLAKSVVLSLLGPSAWAEDKLECSDANAARSIVALGWSIYLRGRWSLYAFVAPLIG